MFRHFLLRIENKPKNNQGFKLTLISMNGKTVNKFQVLLYSKYCTSVTLPEVLVMITAKNSVFNLISYHTTDLALRKRRNTHKQ
jgi:hypothetical protein